MVLAAALTVSETGATAAATTLEESAPLKRTPCSVMPYISSKFIEPEASMATMTGFWRFRLVLIVSLCTVRLPAAIGLPPV